MHCTYKTFVWFDVNILKNEFESKEDHRICYFFKYLPAHRLRKKISYPVNKNLSKTI